jgi:8-oxo-dGTP pyrophosphatase MutT (NUDIX family)
MKEKLTRVAVRAIICDDQNRALIIKRSNTSYGDGKWCLPGGKVDYGVSVLQNLANEIREETTLECLEADYICYLDTLPSPETDMHFVSLVFKCKVSGQVILNDESQEYTWISHDQIKDYAITFDNEKALTLYWGIR